MADLGFSHILDLPNGPNEGGARMTDKDDRERIMFTWISGRVLYKRRFGKYWHCVCGYSKRFCRIAEGPFWPLIFRDCFIENGECEEGMRCLDFDCEYNHTTSESFATNEQMTIKKVLELDPAFGKKTCGINLDENGKLRDFGNFIKGHEGCVIDRKPKRQAAR